MKMVRTITLLLILLMIVPLTPESNLTGGEVITGGIGGGMLTNNIIFDREVEISTLSAIRVALTEEGATLLSPGEVNYNLLPGEFSNALMRVPPWLRDETFTSLWEVLAQDPGNGVISLNAEDVDGDGLMYLLVGEDGNYRLFRNIGGVPPRFVEVPVPVAVDLPLHGWFYPYLIDLDSDGDLDLIAGTEDGIFISFNDPSRAHYYYTINLGLVTARRISLSYMGEEYSNVLNGTALIFAMGERMGGVYMLAIKKYSAPDNSLQYVTRPLGRWGINNTVPFVCRFNIDEIPDILLGDGAGNIRIYLGASSTYLFTMNFNRAGDVEPEFQVGHKPPAPLSPVYFDMTWDQIDDLLIGCGDGRIRMYGQTESTVKNTFWDTWERPQDPVVKNYQHPSRLVRPLPLNVESRAEYSYVRALLEAPRREVDELAFTIAHTPRENLLYDPVNISLLLTTNAHLVYQIAEELRYVRLKDVSTPGGVETTAEYRVRFGEVERWITIPSSIYYWYVVHPRVTEEMALWINPETGNYSPPDEGGEFWRHYLYYHADESYPPDPSPEHCYPKDFPPPLLKEVLSGVEIAWDGVPYTAPRGIDNKGRNNTRPFGYRDHAIEAISNWVEKSLPINQQESGDDERPIQPVRIYHTHNGNCGELQDLTVAAARSALIPTRGVLLTGEDHVWSEFYMGGWHQWDNYWSDGGSVVDHFMNYWWEWGSRGGSGVYSWRGDDSVGDVTLHYVPENRTALLRVIVRCGSSVIPGVRVVVLSDWIATHEVGSPVSVPTPSIWNYTDWRGETTFHICCNKFMIRVVSPMGAYTSDMFEVSPGEEKTIYVNYPGRTLLRGGFLFYGNATESQKVVDGGGKKYLFIVEPEEGCTLQRNFMTGYWTPQPTPSPPLITVVTTFNNTTYSGWSFKTDEYYLGNSIASGGLVIPISLPPSGLIVHLFPPPMFTDIARYRYRIKVVEVGDGMGAVIH
ncbi:MAG: transglutaminase domain-containing protein, partial [Thermoplasmata archaeon]|nr:transglutaminase domain-containing protein [Thermoplasmata archaeon]